MLPILNQSFWRDEAFSVLLSEKNPLRIIALTTGDTTPPLYYILLHYWMLIFGNNEVGARSLSFFLHILMVLVVFLIVGKLIESKFAQILIAVGVLLNPFLLQYAFEARPYSLLAFLTVLAIYLVFINKRFLASVVLSLGILTHNFGLFNFLAFGSWWLYENRNKLDFKEILRLAAAPAVTILLWGGVVWTQWTKVAGGFWITQATSSIFIHSFEKYTQGDLSYPAQPMLYTISLILSFFAFSYWVSKHSLDEGKKPLLLLVSVLILPIFITYVVSALFAPIYHERYLIAAAPTLIILAGYSLYRLYVVNIHLRSIIIALVAVYIALLVQSSEQIVGQSTKPAINWAVSQVLARAEEGDVIIPQNILNYLETKYYVEKSGKNIKVLAYSPTGKIPFYIGAVLFDKKDIITEMPKGVRIFQINTDGGYEVKNSY